jgi:hypothetical protein
MLCGAWQEIAVPASVNFCFCVTSIKEGSELHKPKHPDVVHRA